MFRPGHRCHEIAFVSEDCRGGVARAVSEPRLSVRLTEEQWETVVEGLHTEESDCRQRAELWKGRGRDVRYLREAEDAAAVRGEIKRQLEQS